MKIEDPEWIPPNSVPKRIVLEDTGECRYPMDKEIYIIKFDSPMAVVTERGVEYRDRKEIPLENRLFRADGNNDDWGGKPEDYAIYRIVEIQP